jgi:alkanesulfonate monooxygenase SsuD/methylene tetrahydromethanopterin reductase-like flavin-dependent oxidoreductase (luciferase family)
MRFGIPWVGPEVAREAEAAGVSAFCTGDFVDHEAYVSLAEMTASTQHALVGTAIAYAFARTPYAHAAAVRQLARSAPGRLFLGLGSGAYRINRDWLGTDPTDPVGRLVDCVGAIRAWLHAENGEQVRHEGAHYRVDADVQAPVLGRVEVPILMAAFNRRMAAAAGGTADGVIGHGLFTTNWWNEVVRPATAAGATSANREPDTLIEHGWVITAIDDAAPERAINDARRMIGFYLTVKTYDPYVAHHGWTAEVAAIRTAFAAGDTDRMAAAVTDEMLGQIALCGTTDDAIAGLVARAGGLPRDVAYFSTPTFQVGFRQRQAYARNSFALVSHADQLHDTHTWASSESSQAPAGVTHSPT